MRDETFPCTRICRFNRYIPRARIFFYDDTFCILDWFILFGAFQYDDCSVFMVLFLLVTIPMSRCIQNRCLFLYPDTFSALGCSEKMKHSMIMAQNMVNGNGTFSYNGYNNFGSGRFAFGASLSIGLVAIFSGSLGESGEVFSAS
jgi:hypothetical protein